MVTSEELLIQIRNQITAYQMNLRSETKAHRYNINDRAESFSIPLLKILFGWDKLRNLNTDQTNFPGIDLGDFDNRVAIQVTSETNLKKVKDTLQTFVEKEYFDQFDRLIIFMIQEKQRSYSQEAVDRIIKDKLDFDSQKDIIDLSDLINFIKELSKEDLEKVLKLFKDETGFVDRSFKQVEISGTKSQFYQPGWNIHGEVINKNIQDRVKDGVDEQVYTVVDRALTNQINSLASHITSDTLDRFEAIQQAWREGKKSKVQKWLSDQKSNVDKWGAFSPTLKAKILRFEASLELDRTQDLVKAKQLADQASELAPEDDDTRLRALIAYYEEGPGKALELLEFKDDIDSLNLRAAFLLELGNPDECLLVLSETLLDRGLEPNAETHRLRALAHILLKKINQAQVESQKAIALEPNWGSIRYTKAIIDYFSSLSPVAIQSGHIFWPVPIPEELVKTDDESLSRLRKSAMIFHEFADSPDILDRERLTFEIWYMACLLNDPNTKEEAIKICEAILRENPTDMRAIAWAASRRLDIDLEPSKKELKQLLKDDLADIPQILSLVNIYLSDRKTKGAKYILDQTYKIFKEVGAEAVWYFWYTQILIFQGNPEAALKKIDDNKFTSELKPATTLALQAIAEKTGEWKLLIDHLELSYRETGDPDFLLALCQIMAHQMNWDYVADRGEELITLIQTGEALRIAAYSTYNSGRLEITIGLLNIYQYLFPGSILPNDLLHLRVLCKQNLGIISEAIAEAEKIALENPTAENLLTLIDICFYKGDINRLLLHARKLAHKHDLPSEIYLRLSRMVYLEDQVLAVSLWKKSLTGLPDSFVGEALDLGFRLGLDKETRALMTRMHELGLRGAGGIQIASLDDIKELIAKEQENISYLNEVYSNGTAPIHIIAEQLNRSLSSYYHSLLEENEKSPDPLRQFSLLARHGGRILISGIPENVPAWRLNLDITAILLAEHLEILSKVENAFKPIRIPSLTIPALTQMRENATYHQPSRLDNLRIVHELIENGKIKVVDTPIIQPLYDKKFLKDLGSDWLAIYDEAQTNKGYLVDFLPKKKVGEIISPAKLPEGFEEIVVNCRDVIDALRQHGPLSVKTYEAAIHELGTEGVKIKEIETLRIGSPLYCYANTIEILASTGILVDICESFDVHIDRNMYHMLTSDLAAYELREEEVEWLGQLINKINDGIDRGVYEIIPFSFDTDKNEDLSKNPSLGCFITLLKFEYQDEDVIWVDDRFINGYSRRDVIPIIGINEIIKSLVRAGDLSNDEYFEILTRIRASNLCFLPIQSDEILYHIRQAFFADGQFIETQELINLKHYIAASLFHGKILQRPPMQDGSSNQLGEVEYLLSLGREIIDAIIELWISEEDENTCLARADWLLRNLYIDHLGMSEAVSWQRPNQDDLLLVSVGLSSFIAQAITFPVEEESGIQNRRPKYLDWIYHRLLKARFETNPTLLPTIVEILKSSLFRAEEEDDSLKNIPKSVLMAFHQKYYDDLPEEIKNEFELDSEFMKSLGYTSLIKIGEFEFEPREFLNALSVAVNGNTAIVHPLGSETEVQIKPVDSLGETAVTLTNFDDGTELKIQEDIFALLSNSPSIREEMLFRHRDWFDCNNETLEKIVSEIVSKEDPQERVELTEKWRNTSVSTYYQNLYSQLSKSGPINLNIIRPTNAEALLRNLRFNSDIEPGAAVIEWINLSSENLIEEVGSFEAMSRYWGLPIPLPNTLLEAVRKLSPEEKRSIVKRCLRSYESPVSKIHFIRLLSILGSDNRAYYRLAKRVFRNLVEIDDSEFNAYLSILNWIKADFNLWSDTKVMPSHIRLLLVWAHGHCVYSVFKSLGAPADWLARVFEPFYQPVTSDLFDRDLSQIYDVANPKQANRPRLVLSAIQYCLGENANDFIESGTKELIQNIAFTEIDGITGPDLSLIRDYTQATNALGSFLGESVEDVLTPIFEDDVSNFFSRENLKSLVESSIDKLIEENDSFSSWTQFHAVLDGLPPYKDIVDREILLFCDVDFMQLTEENIMLGILAIHTASLQEPYLDNAGLHTKMRDDIVNVASAISTIDLGEEANHHGKEIEESIEQRIHGLLLDSAVNLSISSNQPVEDFEALITRMIDVNPSMIPGANFMVQRLYDELPINQAKKLSTLLLRLRAER